MRLVHLRVVLLSIVAITLAGCPSGNNSSSGGGGGANKFMGTWQNTTEPGFVIEVKADHKAVLRDKSGPTEGTWETSGEDKLIVHGAMGIAMEFLHNSDGTLRDTMTSSTWKKK